MKPAMLNSRVLETGRCYCCGGTQVRESRDRHGFRHVVCQSCRHSRVHPDELVPSQEVYTNDYFDGTTHQRTGGKLGYAETYADLSTTHRASLYRRYAREVARLARREGLARPRVLDYGCAYGLFLKVLSEELGEAEVHGAEVDPQVCARASANLGGAPVYHAGSPRGRAAIPRGYFDVVTMIDVIEHLDDPQAYLELLAECARPGGHLLVSTPNIESFNARLYGDRWVLHTPPFHTYYFGRRSISALLGRTGWRVIKFETEQTIFHNERAGMETWRGKTSRLLFQNRLCHALTNRMMHVGSIMTVVAERV